MSTASRLAAAALLHATAQVYRSWAARGQKAAARWLAVGDGCSADLPPTAAHARGGTPAAAVKLSGQGAPVTGQGERGGSRGSAEC